MQLPLHPRLSTAHGFEPPRTAQRAPLTPPDLPGSAVRVVSLPPCSSQCPHACRQATSSSRLEQLNEHLLHPQIFPAPQCEWSLCQRVKVLVITMATNFLQSAIRDRWQLQQVLVHNASSSNHHKRLLRRLGKSGLF